MKNGSVNSIPVEVKKLRELNTMKRRRRKKKLIYTFLVLQLEKLLHAHMI